MNRLLTPEHLHVALNHLPLIGLAASLLPLLYGLFRKNTEVLIIALCMCVLFGGSTFAVMWTGETAEDRFEQTSMPVLLDAAGKKWMEIHEDRAKIAAVSGYLVAVIGLVSLVLGKWSTQYRYLGGWVTCIALVTAITLMVWVADSGGQIRHPEFRSAVQSTNSSR